MRRGFLLVLGLCAACAPPARAPMEGVVLDSFCVLPQESLRTLSARYLTEGDEALAGAQNEQDLRDRVFAVQQRWLRVWQAWDGVRDAAEAYGLALAGDTREGPQTLEARRLRLVERYCAMRALREGADLPNAPFYLCSGSRVAP